MEVEYANRKTELKKSMKKMLKEDEKKLESIRKSGDDMIEFLKSENEKLKGKHAAMKNEYSILERQFDVLTMKSDEITRNFSSLQAYVQKKSSAIQKNEMNSQKCRHQYLPKYREMIQDRDRHCIVESKVRDLYKKRLESIATHISNYCRDGTLVKNVKIIMEYLENDLDNMPPQEIPEGLADKLR